MEERGRCISYCVDRNDRITQVDSAWEEFARNNKSADLTAELVIGKPLFRFVSNPDTQYLYRLLMTQARKSSRRVSFPFRCDAPDRRRFMRMDIVPLDDNGLRFESCTLREEQREPVALLDPSAPRSSDLLIICGWCKKVLLSEEEPWVEVEEAVGRLDLFRAPRLPILYHAVCPKCRAAMRHDH